MPDAPYALALTAGVLAAVNPCGFALMPAYLSLLVLGDEPSPAKPPGRFVAVSRALALTAAMTLGFVLVFGVFGALAAPAADLVAQHLPWVSIVIGMALAGLGGWLLAGRDLPAFKVGSGRGPAVSRQFGSMVIFGASYAIASLGCTVGPFLAVVVTAFRSGSILAGAALFLTYALGMGLIVGVAALAVALAKVSLVRGLRRAAPAISRIGGALLIAAGLYVAWYGWYEVRVLRDGDTDDPIINVAGQIQSTTAALVGRLGPVVLTVAFAVLLTAVVVAAAVLRRQSGANRGSS